jgi:hypothetical protein
MARPAAATAPDRLAQRRRQWLSALLAAGRAVGDGAGLSDEQRRWLALALHAARAAGGGAGGDPLPVEAPAWLAQRWAAVAGVDPFVQAENDPGGSAPLPPESAPDPAREAALLLIGGLGTAPETAIGLADAVRQFLAGSRDRIAAVQQAAEILVELPAVAKPVDERDERERLAAAAARAPAMEQALCRLLLAVHAGALAMAERDPVARRDAVVLARTIAAGVAPRLARDLADDPLALALARLALHRAARAEGIPPPAAPAAAGRWAAILAGGPDAADQAMLADQDLLHAGRALCAALAAQECAGTAARWTLLPDWAGRSLPLTLAMPVVAGGGDLEPDLP